MSDETIGNESEANASQERQTETQKLSASNIVDERGVPLTNVMKELNRKIGRVTELSNKIDLLLQQQNKPTMVADNALIGGAELDDATKRYIDARLLEDQRKTIEKKQEVAIQNVLKTFPDLDQDSESFDKEFYDLAVAYEKTIDPMDPDRPLKAAKLAALDTGRIEKLTKAKVIQDDSRRARILSEGGIEAKESKKEKATTMNKNAIKSLLKIDPAKIEKIMKEKN